jgi:hypothetical protein
MTNFPVQVKARSGGQWTDDEIHQAAERLSAIAVAISENRQTIVTLFPISTARVGSLSDAAVNAFGRQLGDLKQVDEVRFVDGSILKPWTN